MREILKVKNLEKCYGRNGNITRALNNVSFDVKQGEYIGIMGASGSGKTTLLNCISTIDFATSGNIIIDEKDVTDMKTKELSKFRREKLGFIFQDFNLLDTLTAYENISLALSITKTDVNEIDEKIKSIAKLLNITEVLNKYPYEMSGGQKQRVASARAIITKPALILADEPTGALDSNSSTMLLKSFNRLNEDMSATILMVTHDSYAASFCKRILFIKDGKVFNEIIKGNQTRKEFFYRISEVISILGGDLDDN